MRSVLLAQSVGTYLYIVWGGGGGGVQCEVSLIGPVGGDISIYSAGGGDISIYSAGECEVSLIGPVSGDISIGIFHLMPTDRVQLTV